MKFVRREFVWIIGAFLFVTGLEERVEGTVTLSPSFSVSESYNDNLFFTETNREADFTTLVGPSFKLAYESLNLTLEGVYRGAAEFHARHPEANKYAQSASFDLGIPFLSRQIRGVEVRVTENLNFTPEVPAYSFGIVPEQPGAATPSSQAQQTGGGIQVPRTDTLTNNAGLKLGYDWSPILKTTISYLNTVTRYRGTELNDSMTHRVGLDETYQWSPRTQWTNSYSAAVTIYENANNEVVHRLSTGVAYQMSPTLSINGNIGFGVVSGIGKISGLIVETGLSKQFSQSSLSLSYAQNIGTGGGLITGSTLYRVVGMQYRQTVGQYTSAYLRIGYANNRSLSGEALIVSSYTAETGINVRLFSWLSGNLGYSYLNQQSLGTIGQDGQRNLVMFGLTASAPPWRIVK